MGLLQRFLARPPAERPTTTTTRPFSLFPRTSATRELMRTALRETLRVQGIPADWIECDVLASKSRGAAGFQWRLIVKHWDPRLVVHAVALEEALFATLHAHDPTASEWLAGISWQFALADRKACPSLPPARTWAVAAKPPRVRPANRDLETARADLNRWMSQHDTEPPLRSPDALPNHWAPTQPAKLNP